MKNFYNLFLKVFVVLLTLGLLFITNVSARESWAPLGGTSKVTQNETFQQFIFSKNISDQFNSKSTYEHETQVYNKNFANYNGYWKSNLPRAYYDTPAFDNKSLKNFTIGSSQASSIKGRNWYYTYMRLKAGTDNKATVRIKGQKGHRWINWIHSTWNIFADATTSSMLTFSAPQYGICWGY